MKKFLTNVIFFFIFLVLVFYIKPMYLLYTGIYKKTTVGAEIYYSISKSKQKKKTRKLLLGDSVAWQLFSNTTNNDTVNSLACNQAISMVGHYILLDNYLTAGNRPDTVYMLFRPFTFLNNLDQIYTYQNFLKPFNKKEYQHLFTTTVKEQIKKIPYNYLCSEPYILTSDWVPDYKPEENETYTFLSPISVEFLNKIKELSLKNNFKLIMVPTPVNLKSKPAIEAINKNEIIKTDLRMELNNYFNNIFYLDDSCFRDGAHLKYPETYTRIYRDKLIK